MSRIAIIDTAINDKWLNGKTVEHINLCGWGVCVALSFLVGWGGTPRSAVSHE